jgi:2-C-methyl-D-erythritol 4-phosphate cytidylyltransferase
MIVKKSLSIILLAGGIGSRLGSKEPKQFLQLGTKPIARHSLDTFLESSLIIQEIIVVCEELYQSFFYSPLKDLRFAKPGKERQLSVLNGFQALSTPVDFVMIHDTARPFITQKEILLLFEEGSKVGAATLATPVTSTIKKTDSNNFVTSTLPRDSLWEIQTPQLLSYHLLKEGLEKATKDDLIMTDDVSLAELLNHPVKLVKGNPLNFKITTQKDLILAHSLISANTVYV